MHSVLSLQEEAQQQLLTVCCLKGDNTPLHWASMRGHVEIVQYLLQHRADRAIRNKQEKMPIDLCQPCWSNAYRYTRQVSYSWLRGSHLALPHLFHLSSFVSDAATRQCCPCPPAAAGSETHQLHEKQTSHAQMCRCLSFA